MKRLFKFTSIVLVVLISVTMLASCATGDKLPRNYTKLPDYSQSDKNYEFLAASGPMNGTFNINSEYVQLGPDQRTEEGYKTFLNAGFNLVYLSGTASNCEPNFEESECKRAMVAAYKAGARKIVLQDVRIWKLSEKGDNLIGMDGEYKTFEDLVAQVKSYMSDYIEQDGFYGIELRDEPKGAWKVADRWVYKAVYTAWQELVEERNIQKPIKDYIFIYQNLFPYTNNYSFFGKPGEFESIEEAYINYVESHLSPTIEGVVDANGEPIEFMVPDILSADVYAPRTSGLSLDFYVTALLLRELCAKYGVRPAFCLSSFETGGYRGPYFSDMMLEMYSLIGMGYDNFTYYTYQPAETRKSLAEWNDQFCFMTARGEKTHVYYAGQKLMGWAQKMGQIILNYDYQGAKFYFSENPTFGVERYLMGNVGSVTLATGGESQNKSALTFDNTKHAFKLLKDVKVSNSVAFVTELYDAENQLYMYMLQNSKDPSHGKDEDTSEDMVATFDSSYTHVAKIKDGNLSYVALNKGVYSETLSAGQAVYLVPLK